MAIKFDLFENPVKEGISSPKLHAKVITKDVVTTREIREAIHKKCTASPADVAAVITALNDELYEKLSDGYTVHLDGIGYFSLSLKCAPDINPRYIKDDDVQVRSIKFTPDKDLINRFRNVCLEREVDDAHPSAKLDEEEMKQKLVEYFKTHAFLQRRDFEQLTGFNSSKEYFSAGIHCIFLELNVWCKVRLCLHGGIRHHCATIADFGQIVGGASKSSSSLRDM